MAQSQSELSHTVSVNLGTRIAHSAQVSVTSHCASHLSGRGSLLQSKEISSHVPSTRATLADKEPLSPVVLAEDLG